jgi:hypothetical protein
MMNLDKILPKWRMRRLQLKIRNSERKCRWMMLPDLFKESGIGSKQ